MHVSVIVVVLLVPLASAGAPCPPVNETGLLLDSCLFENLIPPWTSVDGDGDGNEWEKRENTEMICRNAIETCSANLTLQNNLLVSPFVSSADVLTSNISITVEFSDGNCTTPLQPDLCTPNFGLLIYPTQASDPTGFTNNTNYLPVVSIVPNNTEILYTLPGADYGFYLAFEDTSACVVINRVRVEQTLCLETVNGFAQYNQTSGGQSVMGACVVNAELQASSSLNANCGTDGTFVFESMEPCHCSAGHQVDGNACDECDEGTFKPAPGNEVCEPCPANSNNIGIPNSMCACNRGYARVDSNDITTACSECVTSFYRDGDGCQQCPARSNSSGGTAPNCTCNNNGATSGGSTSTTEDACTGCITGFFNNATEGGQVECVECPANSISVDFVGTSCMCNPGTQLLIGQGPTTISEPCSGCSAGYYRQNEDCVMCPENSDRARSTDDDSECPCIDNYGRLIPDNVQDDCMAIVGFELDEALLSEGETGVDIRISAALNSSVTVNLGSTSLSRDEIMFPNNFTLSSASTIQIVSPENQISLEDSTIFDLSITSVSPSLVIGGRTTSGMLFQSISITLQDNDIVDVGFTAKSVSYDQSESSVMVTVQINKEIATDLELVLVRRTGDSAVISNSTVVFESGGPPTIQLTEDVSGLNNQDLMLQLEFSGPPQHVRLVMIGGGNTNGRIIISLESEGGFPVVAIIGISAGGAGLAVLLLIVVIMCLCICRLRVNRQGFYHTYEDKVSEPPTMLRYSASLRSISSQTVIPATEGKSVSKENEFYV